MKNYILWQERGISEFKEVGKGAGITREERICESSKDHFGCENHVGIMMLQRCQHLLSSYYVPSTFLITSRNFPLSDLMR